MTDGTDVQAASEAAPAESDTTAATTEAAATETTTEATGEDTEADDTAKDDGDDEDDDKPRRATRLERQKRKNAAILADRDAARAEAAELRQRLEGGQKDDRPKEADFNGDYAGFEQAMNAYQIEQVFNKIEAKKAREQAAQREAAARQEKADALDDAVEKARERFPDIDKVLEKAAADGMQILPHVWDEILDSDKQALLLAHLAGKPGKARELNAMSPKQAAREIGRIEAGLSLPTANKSTKAPPPRTAPAGGASAAPDLGKLSMADYIAYRNKGG